MLLVHPGGPFFAIKDEGVWTIPKGELQRGEDLLARACVEFAEEVGITPSGSFLSLGSIKQKGGKVVHAWAFENDLPEGFCLRSNTFLMKWPPGSDRVQEFPEVDRAEFFPVDTARRRLIAAQQPFVDRLVAALEESG